MLESLFNKVADLKACNFIKKRLQDRCFPLKFAIFLKNVFCFIQYLRWLFLHICICYTWKKIWRVHCVQYFHNFNILFWRLLPHFLSVVRKGIGMDWINVTRLTCFSQMQVNSMVFLNWCIQFIFPLTPYLGVK